MQKAATLRAREVALVSALSFGTFVLFVSFVRSFFG